MNILDVFIGNILNNAKFLFYKKEIQRYIIILRIGQHSLLSISGSIKYLLNECEEVPPALSILLYSAVAKQMPEILTYMKLQPKDGF